jgi:hypothetical protein
MTLDRFMAEFAERHGRGSYARSSDGVYSLTFDERYTVHIEDLAGENAIILNSFVCSLHDVDDHMLRDMLAANLQLRQNGGAAISLDPDREELLLTRVIDADNVDVDRFERQLECFVDHLENVLQLVEGAEKSGQAGVAPRSVVDWGELRLIRV